MAVIAQNEIFDLIYRHAKATGLRTLATNLKLLEWLCSRRML